MYLTLPLKLLQITGIFAIGRMQFARTIAILFMQQKGDFRSVFFDKKMFAFESSLSRVVSLIIPDIKLIPNNTRLAIDFLSASGQ